METVFDGSARQSASGRLPKQQTSIRVEQLRPRARQVFRVRPLLARSLLPGLLVSAVSSSRAQGMPRQDERSMSIGRDERGTTTIIDLIDLIDVAPDAATTSAITSNVHIGW